MSISIFQNVYLIMSIFLLIMSRCKSEPQIYFGKYLNKSQQLNNSSARSSQPKVFHTSQGFVSTTAKYESSNLPKTVRTANRQSIIGSTTHYPIEHLTSHPHKQKSSQKKREFKINSESKKTELLENYSSKIQNIETGPSLSSVPNKTHVPSRQAIRSESGYSSNDHIQIYPLYGRALENGLVVKGLPKIYQISTSKLEPNKAEYHIPKHFRNKLESKLKDSELNKTYLPTIPPYKSELDQIKADFIRKYPPNQKTFQNTYKPNNKLEQFKVHHFNKQAPGSEPKPSKVNYYPLKGHELKSSKIKLKQTYPPSRYFSAISNRHVPNQNQPLDIEEYSEAQFPTKKKSESIFIPSRRELEHSQHPNSQNYERTRSSYEANQRQDSDESEEESDEVHVETKTNKVKHYPPKGHEIISSKIELKQTHPPSRYFSATPNRHAPNQNQHSDREESSEAQFLTENDSESVFTPTRRGLYDSQHPNSQSYERQRSSYEADRRQDDEKSEEDLDEAHAEIRDAQQCDFVTLGAKTGPKGKIT